MAISKASFDVADTTGFRMHYEIISNVVPEDTLFIHGNLASNRWWQPSVNIWAENAQGKDLKGSLILAEWRGCGLNAAPSPEHIEMKRLAADYVSLLKFLGKTSVNVVGHSTGGLIALLAMHQAPKLFRKAVLLDPVGAQGITFDPSMTQAFEMMKKDKGLVAAVMGSTIYKNDEKSPFFQTVIVEDGFSAVKNVGELVLKALDGLDIRSQVREIPHPVLVLHGKHDLLLPIQGSQDLAKLLPSGEFEVIEDHGHCLNVEDPKKFVSRVNAYLFSNLAMASADCQV